MLNLKLFYLFYSFPYFHPLLQLKARNTEHMFSLYTFSKLHNYSTSWSLQDDFFWRRNSHIFRKKSEMSNFWKTFFDRLFWSNKQEKNKIPRKINVRKKTQNKWNSCLFWQRLLLCQVTVDGADGLESINSFFWVILWWGCFIETYINKHYLV